MPVHGLNELTRRLESFSRKLESLDGQHSIPLTDLFHPQFMARHTSFQTIDEMLSASGFDVQSQEDFAAIPDGEWDGFVAERTEFKSWDEMKGAAAEEWASSKLQF